MLELLGGFGGSFRGIGVDENTVVVYAEEGAEAV